MPRSILLNTVGTSLIFPNLNGLKDKLAAGTVAEADRPLASAFATNDWNGVANALAGRDLTERMCGAEVNSIASLLKHRYIPPDAGFYFFHSDTDEGRNIAAALVHLYRQRGHSPVEAVQISDLQDNDPKKFRTHGLRNLAKLLCAKVRTHVADACAINATGGYKAQVAIAVLLGQALGIPVYYMHERFSEIIAFPPLPVALDFEVWMRASGLLLALERETEPVARSQFDDDEWDERYESLVEAVTIDGSEFIELSAAGQIFHETFRERFRSHRDQVLPPPAAASRKQPPTLKTNEGHMLAQRGIIEPFLRRLTDQVPSVVGCVVNYYNPDLPQRTRFREVRGEIEGIFSDGKWAVKFKVETTAQTAGQRAAVVAALNEWLVGQK